MQLPSMRKCGMWGCGRLAATGWILLLVLGASGCGGNPSRDSPSSLASPDGYCKTRFPVVLSYHWGGTVEGTLHRGQPTSGTMASFNLGMVEAVRARGALVRVVDKYNYETGSRYETTEYRARRLAEEIERFLDETRPADWDERVHGRWKVNLIGHSQGAVDGRYMIALLRGADGTPMHERVASYTSLAGIHGGSLLADLFVWFRDDLLGEDLYDLLEAILLPAMPEEVQEDLSNEGFWPSMICLTTGYMDAFNERIVPLEQSLRGVAYRKSWASMIRALPEDHWQEMGLQWLYLKLHSDGGDNDFYVTVDDQRFGETEVLAGAPWSNGLHHMAFSTVAMPRRGGPDGPEAWDVRGFFVDLLHGLKEDGF